MRLELFNETSHDNGEASCRALELSLRYSFKLATWPMSQQGSGGKQVLLFQKQPTSLKTIEYYLVHPAPLLMCDA